MRREFRYIALDGCKRCGGEREHELEQVVHV